MAPPSDAALVRYLLGTADREDEERFDELSVTDADFAERLRAIEHDLADAYARGELPASDRERWEARYLASQHGRDDLALAQAFADRERGGSKDPPYEGRHADNRYADNWYVGRVFRPGVWQLASAAVLVLAIVAGYRIAHKSRPLTSVAQQPTIAPAPASTPATPSPTRQVVALTLLPSVRSIDEPATLTIPRGTTDVKLTLRLEPDDYHSYTVALRDLTSNTIAWNTSGVAAEGTAASRSIAVTIPASVLQRGRYLINVSAESSRANEIVATYPLIVVLQ